MKQKFVVTFSDQLIHLAELTCQRQILLACFKMWDGYIANSLMGQILTALCV